MSLCACRDYLFLLDYVVLTRLLAVTYTWHWGNFARPTLNLGKFVLLLHKAFNCCSAWTDFVKKFIFCDPSISVCPNILTDFLLLLLGFRRQSVSSSNKLISSVLAWRYTSLYRTGSFWDIILLDQELFLLEVRIFRYFKCFESTHGYLHNIFLNRICFINIFANFVQIQKFCVRLLDVIIRR